MTKPNCIMYTIIKDFLPIFISIGLPIFLYYKGVKQWKKQKNYELDLKRKQEEKQQNLLVIKSIYSLVKYLTDKENSSNIVRHITLNNEKSCCFSVDRFHEFNTQVSELFYGKGYGLYLDEDLTEIKKLLFGARGVLYAFYNASQDAISENNLIKIEDKGLLKKYHKTRDEFIVPKIKELYNKIENEDIQIK